MEPFMNSFGYPFLMTAATALLALAVTWIKQRLNIQADATANAAVQNAVQNFAGKVMLDVASGKLTLADVKAGRANQALIGYVGDTVSDSVKQLGVTPQTLATMLVGKLGTALSVPVEAAAAPGTPSLVGGVPVQIVGDPR